MNVQHIHGEVVRSQVHRRKHFVHRHLVATIHANLSRARLESSFSVDLLQHLFFAVCLQRLLDKSEQVLLVHGGGSVDVSVHLDEKQVVEVLDEKLTLRTL